MTGAYGGRSDDFVPGGLSFEVGFCPHGGEDSPFMFVPTDFSQCEICSLRRGLRCSHRGRTEAGKDPEELDK